MIFLFKIWLGHNSGAQHQSSPYFHTTAFPDIYECWPLVDHHFFALNTEIYSWLNQSLRLSSFVFLYWRTLLWLWVYYPQLSWLIQGSPARNLLFLVQICQLLLKKEQFFVFFLKIFFQLSDNCYHSKEAFDHLLIFESQFASPRYFWSFICYIW